MCKRVLIAAVAVIVGLAIVSGTRVGSHLRLWKKRATAWAEKQVTPETEIQRLRMEIERLEKQDAVFLHKVAEQRLELRDRETKLNKDKAEVAKLEKRITDLRVAVHEAKQANRGDVVYVSETYPVRDAEEQVSRDWARFQPMEAALKSQEAFVTTLRNTLNKNEEKRLGLQKTRQEMLTQLQELENQLAELRQQKTGKAAVLDDSGYSRVQADIDALKRRIAVEKEARTMQTSTGRGPIEVAEEQRERDETSAKALNERFPVGGQVAKKN